MFFTRVVPLVWAALPFLQEAELPKPEVLYQQAYSAINSGDTDAAIIYLSCLVNYHPESDHTAAAVITLVEFDLIHGRHFSAIEKIINWSDRELDSIGKQAKKTGDINNRRLRLLVTAIDRLDQQQADQLGDKLSGAKDSASAVELIVIRELARRELQNQQFEQALKYFGWLGDTVDSRERQLRDFALPLYLLQHQPSQKSIQLARRSLDSNNQLDPGQRFHLHWSIVEVFSQQKDHQSAMAELTSIASWLRGLSEAKGPADSEDDSDPLGTQLHQWQAATDLRLGELLAMTGQMSKAESLASLALQNYPGFPDRAGFRFLLTRCYIADIEFDKAARQLQVVLSESDSTAESQAKAHWMLGEIRLMQKRYDQAIEHYSAALAVKGQFEWHSRALFQIAKCHEAQSRLMLAVSVYQDLIDKYPQSDLFNPAQERLSYLSTLLR